MINNKNPIHLEVEDLCKYYALKRGFFDRRRGVVKAVDGVSFSIQKGEVFGLVGESGCGKTTIGRLILRVLDPTNGSIRWSNTDGEVVDLTRLKRNEMRSLRQQIQMVFQDPYASLDPRMTVMQIIGEPLRANKLASGKDYQQRIAEAMEKVRLRPEMMNRYPHAFSGGQRQRIGIARALITEPGLVIADEPVSALDVSVQAQILNLLQDLQAEMNLTLLMVAHDLSVIRHICDTVAVMYLGKLVEIADQSDLFTTPRHPYTELLLDSVPRFNFDHEKRVVSKGTIDDAADPPAGCCFHTRCRYQKDRCQMETPPLRSIGSQHSIACHFDIELKGIK